MQLGVKAAEELAAAVRAAATGTAVYARAVAERMLDRGRRPDETLTPRELDVLELLADGSTPHSAARFSELLGDLGWKVEDGERPGQLDVVVTEI